MVKQGDIIIDFLNQDSIKNHTDLAGIVLLGSFSSNQGDELSDIDIKFIYFNDNYTPVQLPPNEWEWDICECTLADFSKIASYDNRECEALVTADVLLDKTGEIKDKINKFINPGFDYFKENLGNTLDAYYNQYYRSMKCLRRKNLIGAHVMACISMNTLNIILYHINGLLQTYLTRLPETIHKLKNLPMPANELFDYMTNISVTADARSQIQVYLSVKEMMNKLGYFQVYEAWEGKLDKEIELAL